MQVRSTLPVRDLLRRRGRRRSRPTQASAIAAGVGCGCEFTFQSVFFGVQVLGDRPARGGGQRGPDGAKPSRSTSCGAIAPSRTSSRSTRRVSSTSSTWLSGQVARPRSVACRRTALRASPARSWDMVSSEAVPITARSAPSGSPEGSCWMSAGGEAARVRRVGRGGQEVRRRHAVVVPTARRTRRRSRSGRRACRPARRPRRAVSIPACRGRGR